VGREGQQEQNRKSAQHGQDRAANMALATSAERGFNGLGHTLDDAT
jgi:hypothetical protein